MGNLLTATIFIVFINVIMWFSALAMTNINPTGTICYHVEGSIIGDRINMGIVENNVANDLPDNGQGNVAPSSSGFITDLFNNILGWFKSKFTWVYNVVGAPYNILKCMGLPNEIVLGLGSFWYLISLLVLLSYIWWRD